jgi:hypothetical protein
MVLLVKLQQNRGGNRTTQKSMLYLLLKKYILVTYYITSFDFCILS